MNTNTSQWLHISASVAVILLALSSVSYVSYYGRSTDQMHYRSFGVTGEGKITAIPDVAQFSFSVITEGGNDLAKLQTENVTKMNKAIDFIKSKGVETKDITTRAFSVQPRYQNNICTSMGICPPPQIVGYTVHQSVEVKARKFDHLGELVGGVVQQGANEVSQLNFVTDDPSTLQTQARQKALKDATEKAEAMASAGGFKLGRLLSVEDAYGVQYDGMSEAGIYATKMGGPVAPSPIIEPGSQEVHSSVNVRYEIR